MIEKNRSTETIIFGGGCFWCMEAVFQMLRGVQSVTSGYAGGTRPNPTYHDVVSGKSAHAEVIQVIFDPSVIAMGDLLAVFFTTHDPTTLNRQGNDVGPQYRSVIFYTTTKQKITIDAFIKNLAEEKIFSRPIVTEILPAPEFFPAESYHQNYYRNNSEQGYCQVIIDPKINQLRQRFAHLLT